MNELAHSKSMFMAKQQEYFQLTEGVFYLGEMKNGKPHGNGIMLNFD